MRHKIISMLFLMTVLFAVSALAEPTDIQPEPVFGSDDAPVKITAYMGYNEPFSRIAWDSIISNLKDDFKGQIQFEFRNFPFAWHDNAFLAAEAGECVLHYKGKRRFLEFSDTLFREVITSDLIYETAENAGVSNRQLDRCLNSGKPLEEVQHDIFEGENLGVAGIPTFFVNGLEVIGAVRYDVFREIVEDALAGIEDERVTDLADYPEMFVEHGIFRGLIVVEGQVPALTAVDIASNMFIDNKRVSIPVTATILPSELDDGEERGVIAIGNKACEALKGRRYCRNAMSRLDAEVSVIILDKNDNLIVIGRTDQALRRAGKVLARAGEFDLHGRIVLVHGTSSSDISIEVVR